jgi:hypothetical protein
MGLFDTLLMKGDDKPYCTAAQLTLFKKAREGGQVTFFRAGKCACGTEIPKSKTFCSTECWEKSKEEA